MLVSKCLTTEQLDLPPVLTSRFPSLPSALKGWKSEGFVRCPFEIRPDVRLDTFLLVVAGMNGGNGLSRLVSNVSQELDLEEGQVWRTLDTRAKHMLQSLPSSTSFPSCSTLPLVERCESEEGVDAQGDSKAEDSSPTSTGKERLTQVSYPTSAIGSPSTVFLAICKALAKRLLLMTPLALLELPQTEGTHTVIVSGGLFERCQTFALVLEQEAAASGLSLTRSSASSGQGEAAVGAAILAESNWPQSAD